MKIINLQGLTTGERLAYLEEICQEIYNHLYDDYIWVYAGAYIDNKSTYSATRLNGYQDNLDLKSKQIVYFSESGVVAIINQINDAENTFTVIDNYSIKGDKGDKGATGEKGETGETGKTGATGLSALQTSQIIVRESVPSINATFTFDESLCNRTPVPGDIFMCVMQGRGSVLGRSWLATCIVLNESEIKGQIKNFVETTGTNEQRLYAHYIEFSYGKINGSNNGIIWAGFNWIDTNPNIITSEYQSNISDFVHEIINRVGTAYTTFYITAETINGTAISNESHCICYSYSVKNNDLQLKCRNQNNSIIQFMLLEFANSISDCKLTIIRNNAYAIGSYGTPALVLYSDENGVLLDNETLSEQFTKLVSAGSNESKILDSINKTRSMK